MVKQAAEGDDERGHADVGNDEALHGAERGANRDTDGQGDRPGQREIGRQVEVLGNQSVISSA